MRTVFVVFGVGMCAGLLILEMQRRARKRTRDCTGPAPEWSRAPRYLRDEVDIASELSFPASDPPAY